MAKSNPPLQTRESFDNIFLDLSSSSGRCRFAENGFGWKPSGGGDTFTLDASNIGGAQWSRASKGYEVKIMLRGQVAGLGGAVQLDGFVLEVGFFSPQLWPYIGLGLEWGFWCGVC
jgi:hypothetical protein